MKDADRSSEELRRLARRDARIARRLALISMALGLLLLALLVVSHFD